MKRVITEVVDDIDGTPGAQTHTLAIDGYAVVVDLCEANRKRLYDILRPFLDAGQRAPGTRRRPKQPGRTTSEIRVWWKRNPNGLPTWQQRGAIPVTVLDAWNGRGRS